MSARSIKGFWEGAFCHICNRRLDELAVVDDDSRTCGAGRPHVGLCSKLLVFFCCLQAWSRRWFFTRRVLSHRRIWLRRWLRCTSSAQSNSRSRTITTSAWEPWSLSLWWPAHWNDRIQTKTRTWCYLERWGTRICRSFLRTTLCFSRCCVVVVILIVVLVIVVVVIAVVVAAAAAVAIVVVVIVTIGIF